MNAKEMAETFCVSERTARRHIAKGTTPYPHRTLGRDGKIYPASQLGPDRRSQAEVIRTLLSNDLVMARNAVRRVARAKRFESEDLEVLRTIATEAGKLLRHWLNIIEAREHRRL